MKVVVRSNEEQTGIHVNNACDSIKVHCSWMYGSVILSVLNSSLKISDLHY